MEGVNVENLSLDEQIALSEKLKVAILAKRNEAKETEKAEKAARAEKFKTELKVGDNVLFLYGREDDICNGTVVRISEKSATVESSAFDKGKNYVRFDRFVKVVEVEGETE